MAHGIYDVLIVGGGPAGYTAALYAVRAGLSVAIVEKMAAGGQMCETAQIENYPAIEEIDGYTIGDKMKAGAERFGAVTVFDEVTALSLTEEMKTATTASGAVLRARAVILAMGAVHRHLGVAREADLVGAGVAYCATCDGMFFRGKRVAVVGGGNSAAADAIFLSGICAEVTLIHRRDTLRATKSYHTPLMAKENVKILYNHRVKELLGAPRLSGVMLENTKTGEARELALDGLFISVGRAPNTALLSGQVALDDAGYILAGEDTKTSLRGVFAAGDIRTKPLRQIITAAADGATAAHMAELFLAGAE